MAHQAGDTHILHVRLLRDDDGYPPFDSEEIPASLVADHTYRLIGTPAFASGLARDDVVRVRHIEASATEWVDTLLESGNHSTVRVVALGGRSTDEPRRLAEAQGCFVSATPVDGLIAIDVPGTVDFRDLLAALKEGREMDVWDYDIGVVSDTHLAQLQGAPLT